MTQPNLLDQCRRDAYLQPIDTHVIEPEEVARLSGQNAIILARLRKGPATNSELAKLSLKYTSRLSDIRAAGYVIACERRPKGLSIYTLESTEKA